MKLLPRVPAGAKPPPIRWWGNAFYRVWADFEQLVIVVRLPWWRGNAWLPAQDDIGRGQLVVSWRQREGFRYGWRAA